MEYPPSHVCKRLAEFEPSLRLGWDGEARSFALLQVFHRHDADRSFREPWGHGPTFSKSGRPIRDWNPLTHRALYILRLDEKSHVNFENDRRIDDSPVYYNPKVQGWGYLFKLLKQWARPIASRTYRSAKQKGRDTERRVEAMAHEMASRVYREGQRSGAGAPILARKFAEPTLNQLRHRNGELDFTDKKLPPAPKEGWAAALARDRVGDSDPDDLGSI